MASIKRRGSSYIIRCSAGYDIYGKQIIKSLTWRIPEGMSDKKAEKEAQHQAALFEEAVRNGEVLEGKIKFADFAEKWFQDYAELQLRPKTIAVYKEYMPRINAAIGHIAMDKIRPLNLMNFYQSMQQPRIEHKYKSIQNFKELLKEKDLTKVAASKLCEVTIHDIDALCRGEHIRSAKAEKVAQKLNLSLKKDFRSIEIEHFLSENSILHYHRLISSILSTAVKWQVITSNPASRVQPPKLKKKEAVYLDEVQAAELLELIQDAPPQYRTAIEVLLFTGLRRGELLGLKWSDVDFDNNVIAINRSTLYHPSHGIYEDDLKNSTSKRIIKVPSAAMQSLRRHKAWQAEQRLMLGTTWHKGDWLFTTWNGYVMHPDTLSNWFSKFVKKTDLPPIHLHSLRHTNASLLIASGTNLQTVAKRLGHADTTTTSKIYSHAIQSADAAAAEVLDDILLVKHSAK